MRSAYAVISCDFLVFPFFGRECSFGSHALMTPVPESGSFSTTLLWWRVNSYNSIGISSWDDAIAEYCYIILCEGLYHNVHKISGFESDQCFAIYRHRVMNFLASSICWGFPPTGLLCVGILQSSGDQSILLLFRSIYAMTENGISCLVVHHIPVPPGSASIVRSTLHLSSSR